MIDDYFPYLLSTANDLKNIMKGNQGNYHQPEHDWANHPPQRAAANSSTPPWPPPLEASELGGNVLSCRETGLLKLKPSTFVSTKANINSINMYQLINRCDNVKVELQTPTENEYIIFTSNFGLFFLKIRSSWAQKKTFKQHQ